MNKVKVGSFVTSAYHPYDKKLICEVDRIYIRGAHNGTPCTYCRLVYKYNGLTRTCNVPIQYCVIDLGELRNKKLIDILG